MVTKQATKKRWQFLWCWDEDFPDKDMRQRVYIAPTIEKACDKMVAWVRRAIERRLDRQQINGLTICIDYEARAEHLPFTVPHQEKYPDLTKLNHPINEFI